MNAGAEDPNCGISSLLFTEPAAVTGICEHGREKGLSRLNDMGKSNWPLAHLYRIKLARDRFARCDALKKFR